MRGKYLEEQLAVKSSYSSTQTNIPPRASFLMYTAWTVVLERGANLGGDGLLIIEAVPQIAESQIRGFGRVVVRLLGALVEHPAQLHDILSQPFFSPQNTWQHSAPRE